MVVFMIEGKDVRRKTLAFPCLCMDYIAFHQLILHSHSFDLASASSDHFMIYDYDGEDFITKPGWYAMFHSSSFICTAFVQHHGV